MSNHSSDYDETMSAHLARMKEQFVKQELGPLGHHPEGRLTPQDEGAIQFAVGVKDAKVVIDFGSPVSWVGMPPEQAMALAQLLVKRAREICNTPFTLNIG